MSPYRLYSVVGIAVGLVLTIICVIVLDLPVYLAWVIGLSVCTFAIYGFDKRQAIAGGGRVPEAVLHGLALLGGFPGGWAGRAAFRHKTRHASFLFVLVIATVIHIVIGFWLLG
jgi:uncharacterized membrane protein YsdA (DUF1294 family)